jgi:acetyl esterase
MGEIFDSAYVPDPRDRGDRLVSPAGPRDTADLTGIAPAVVVTAEYDRLKAEAVRYAERLRAVGDLVEHHDVARADHGYDAKDVAKAEQVYALVADRVRRATADRPL